MRTPRPDVGRAGSATPFRRRPQSLVGILLATYWTAFADDPLSALLFVVLASTGIVLLAIVVDVAVFLVAQLVAAVL